MNDLVSQLVGALNRLYVAAPTGLECNSFHHSRGEFHSHSEPCKPAAEYVEALAQARAALTAAKAGGWQGMESAPKDGTSILVWRKHATRPLIARYWKDFDWFEDEDGVHLYGLTHWQPLPNPPKEQA